MQQNPKSELTHERHNAIMELLLQHDHVSVTALAVELGVSEATIRKDLTQLAKQGLLRRVHGGAIHVRELTYDIAQFYQNREVKNITEKRRIGQAAAQQIENGQVVAFSSGSTPLQIAHQIPENLHFTAITNDLAIVRVLAQYENIDIFVPGGYLRLGRETLIGPNSVPALQDLKIDLVFLTVTGLDLTMGATAGHITNVVYLRELVARSEKCIVVADHSKFENPPQVVICSWNAIDVLITDDDLSDMQRQQIESQGLSIIIV